MDESENLLTKTGKRLLDTPKFPAEWKKIAKVHADALELYRKSDIIWTVLSPSMLIEKGTKQSKYRAGKDDLLIDSTGHSRISFDDYAIAFLDELEDPKHLCERFTVAY